MNDQDRLAEGLRAMARGMAGEQAPPELETALRAEFRRHRRLRVWRRGAVASLVAASAAAVWLLGPGQRPTPVALVPPPPALENREAVPLDRARPPGRAMPDLRVRRGRGRPPHVAQEVATEFIPLGPLESPVRGSLVRMRLPRSALTVFGLPVNQNRMAERISADVLFGEDGVARAIRFVQ